MRAARRIEVQNDFQTDSPCRRFCGMVEFMWRIIRSFGKVLFWLGSLLGLFYLPADVMNPNEALGAWGRIIGHFDIWIFSLILVVYLAWVEFRPYRTAVWVWLVGHLPKRWVSPKFQSYGTAVRYIVEKSSWAEQHHDGARWFSALHKDIRAALYSGRIRAEGVKTGNLAGQQIEPHTTICKEDWGWLSVSLKVFFEFGYEQPGKAIGIDPDTGINISRYVDVRLSMRDIEALWPPLSLEKLANHNKLHYGHNAFLELWDSQ